MTKISKILNLVNKKMKRYAKGYKAEFLGKINNKCVKITLSVVGNGDYLPKYSGNLDIITNMATYIADSVRQQK